MQKYIYVLILLLVTNYFSYAQFVYPSSQNVTIQGGAHFSTTLALATYNDGYHWDLISVSNTGINVSPSSGTINSNQTIGISVSGSSTIAQQFQLTFRFRNIYTNNIILRSVYINVQHSPCVDYRTITQPVYITNEYKSANIKITALNTIHNFAKARYNAGTRVHLKPGFKVKKGGRFRGFIRNCSNIAYRDTSTSNNNSVEIKIKERFNNELLDNKVILYPNPFDNLITIKTNQEVRRWDIYNILHQKIMSGYTKNINTSELLTGSYIIHISLNSGKMTHKNIFKK